MKSVENLPTVAIYGIPDRDRYQYPKFTHDSAICVMESGRVLSYLQIERATGIKNDNRLVHFIDTLIDEHGVDLPDRFDLVSVNSRLGNAFISRSGRFRFEADRQRELHGRLIPARGWFGLQSDDNCIAQAWLCEHELAHVASCLPFYNEFRPNSLLVHFDGGASLSNFSVYFSASGRVDDVQPILSHWELLPHAHNFDNNALVFALLQEETGSHGSAPGKLMGLASYGLDNSDVRKWLQANDYFRDEHLPQESIMAMGRSMGYDDAALAPSSAFARDIAHAIQRDFQQALLAAIFAAQSQTQARHLFYSGGCALNIVANTAMIESGRFETVSVPPCPGDSGLALGAAALLEAYKHGRLHTHSPYLNSIGLRTVSPTFTAETVARTAQLLLSGAVIGVCNGYGEVGPRALGNRSLVALGNSTALRDRVSIECKGREAYRPVAPVMLHEVAQLVTGQQTIPAIARFMLYDFYILPSYRDALAGVVHVDGTARIQVLRERSENPFLYDLLLLLWRKHQVAALINTSFNRRGQPIVHFDEDAYRAATDMGLDALVVQGRLTVLRTPIPHTPAAQSHLSRSEHP
ncbi:MAG: carbamoyltransferase C-terminal domain-containing protein [Actinomycetota bacterium]